MAIGRVLQGSSRACSVGVGDRSRERKSARDPATGAGSLSARKDERVRTVFAFVKLVLNATSRMCAMLAPFRGKHANQGTARHSPRPRASQNSASARNREPPAGSVHRLAWSPLVRHTESSRSGSALTQPGTPPKLCFHRETERCGP